MEYSPSSPGSKSLIVPLRQTGFHRYPGKHLFEEDRIQPMIWKKLGLEWLLFTGFSLVMAVATISGITSIASNVAIRRESELAAADAHRALLATE